MKMHTEAQPTTLITNNSLARNLDLPVLPKKARTAKLMSTRDATVAVSCSGEDGFWVVFSHAFISTLFHTQGQLTSGNTDNVYVLKGDAGPESGSKKGLIYGYHGCWLLLHRQWH